MISARTMVHLPDTTYGGTPIDWNYADNSKNELQQLRADNAKLRELVKSMYYDLTQTTFPPDWVTDYEADMRELGVEVDE